MVSTTDPNCWAFMRCGREPGGACVEELGVCPASVDASADGLNGSTNGGRICWSIAGTLCGGRVRGAFAEKQASCTTCPMFHATKATTPNFVLLKPNIVEVLVGQSHRIGENRKYEVAKGIDNMAHRLLSDPQALRALLPPVYARVLEYCAGGAVDIAQVERLLATDAAMSATVIAASNSSLFGEHQATTKLRDAIVRIGAANLQAAVLLSAVQFGFPAPGFEALVAPIRHRAVVSGVAARIILAILGKESQAGLLVGLLHDVGELILLSQCAGARVFPADLLSHSTLKAVADTHVAGHHTAVGAAFCRLWHLPAAVIEAAEGHPQGVGFHAKLAVVADLLTAHLGVGGPRTLIDPERCTACADLGLSVENTRDCLVEMERLAGFVA